LTILDCLQSVANQEFKDYEIIIVDDGSSDNSYHIITKFLKNHNFQYQLFRQVNSGPSSARNIGIDNAKYNIIAFLDSDDLWAPWHLAYLLKYYALHSEYPIVCCRKGDFSQKHGFRAIGFKSILFKCYVYSSCMIVQKDIIKEFYFSTFQKYSEDYRLWLQIASSGYKFLLLKQCSAGENKKKSVGYIAGLSQNLWEMECGELSNYRYLYTHKKISLIIYSIVVVYSILKYIKRVNLHLFKIIIRGIKIKRENITHNHCY
jgi:glycosyltransferase involved in cell wall biosynthesis